ncbi:MAG: DUF1864 family protein [Chloroflexota bacterium]|jgi:hypothetical protein
MDTNGTFLSELRTVVHNEIPRLNDAIEKGEDEVGTVVRTFLPWFSMMKETFAPERLPRAEARTVIQLIGFVIGSVERHLQSAHLQAGQGLALFPGMEDYLTKLAISAQHPPRDTHYTYWLWNNGEEPLSFTGDPQEIFFNRAVNHTHELHTLSCDWLRVICEGQINIVSPEARTIIQNAANNNMVLHDHFRSFMSRDPVSGQRAVEPHFFMTRMRTYLPTYQINSTEWTGVNAANLAAQMQLDYLVGTTLDSYENTVRGRLRYMTSDDRRSLEYDMHLPSLLDLFLQQMSLTRADMDGLTNDTLETLIAMQSDDFRRNLAAYINLVTACGRLSSMHWALIQNYLVKASTTLSAEERARLSVDPEKGTGGKTHKETEAIMRMRLQHPLVAKLMEAMSDYDRLPLAV